jgi:fumarate reductase subunit C
MLPHKAPAYTEYHPRWYRPRVSVYWWLGQWQYLRFILRELSSVFVGLVVVMTLLQLRALRNGPEAYARFQQHLRSPGVVVVSMLSLIFVLFHTVTWFNLAPRAMAVRMHGKRIPEWWIAAPNYVVWIAASGVVSWLVLR